uniref:Uncharacterized protein n=1 Tax=Anguilla anguilla TaxID=7936 RepID=A0A0E9U1C9_ANGAN
MWHQAESMSRDLWFTWGLTYAQFDVLEHSALFSSTLHASRYDALFTTSMEQCVQ